MIQHKPHHRIQTSLIVLVCLITLSGVILGLSTGGFILNFKEIGFSIISSAQKAVKTVSSGIANAITAVSQMNNLRKEYERLTQELQNYEYMKQSNAEIRKENQRLKEQLDFVERFEYKNCVAEIIGRDPNNQYSQLTIGKGSRHGIKKNMPVIAIQNGTVGLVGKVVSVGFVTSMVMPVYDYNCNVSARIQKTRDIGLVSGQGNVNHPLSMGYIRKRVLPDLQYGDLVVTSGENENYIKDIPIGYISEIKVRDYDSSLDIEITPVLDFGRLETVIVVDMKEQNQEAVTK
ncbi:MAG: rod shape-determining protein MreC [Spirochaetaceae bacterium]|nr:rod shape-determining protein MreC [Spirochaetaceae bacterium]